MRPQRGIPPTPVLEISRELAGRLESSLRSLVMAADDADFAEFVEFALFVREVVNQGVNLPAENVPRPRFRDRQNPLEYFSDGEFLYRYRFTKETVVDLLARLPVEENDTNRGLPIPPMLQLPIALRFYGAGTFQVVTGDLVNVSQPTVCRAVKRMSELIAGCLFRAEVTFPDRPESFHDIACDFYKIAKFPGVTGCIDCTHVRIKAPGGPNGEVYRNRKGYFSINVQVSSLLVPPPPFTSIDMIVPQY
ncbi:hypothetical protein HPB48_013618 [Haemaphysalis longicornis]|uniref:Nuclease HARBI1 n=1 Tax=Haemaphysalis longicornis TaxID=44386 RepID=A0A9J6FWV0_HAELO|nr:hypothetical protein HPB48_013618 [Haemaphysalis longicornis]